MNKLSILLLILVVVSFSGCVKQPYEPTGNIIMPPEFSSEIKDVIVEEPELEAIIQIEEEIIGLDNKSDVIVEFEEKVKEAENEQSSKIDFDSIAVEEELPKGVFKKITADEKELVSLNINAQDPDGNKLMYTFSEPLSEEGVWETKRGDAGEYIINITVSDGDLSTMTKILLVVNSINKVPVMEKIGTINIEEGETITLDPSAVDGNNDTIVFSYSGLMDKDSYEISFDDVICEEEVFDCSKTFNTIITASDGFSSVTQDVGIVVSNVNRLPILQPLNDLSVKEEETVELMVEAMDPDGDELKYSFTSPLDNYGKLVTERGNAGEYVLYVTASDGDLSSSEKLTLTIESINEDPILVGISDVVVDETDSITLAPTASDANNDTITYTFSGWMNGESYATTYDDAGEHVVTITATDKYGGMDSIDVNVIVNNVNRAPTILGIY